MLFSAKRLYSLLLVFIICACSTTETATPLLRADFSFNADPSKPGKIAFLNESESAQFYEWNFGDGFGFSNEKNPTNTFLVDDTFQVSLTAFYSEKGDGKFPGSRSGIGEKITKKVVVSNTNKYFTAKISRPGQPPIYFRPFTAASSNLSSNSIKIFSNGRDNHSGQLSLIVPNSAKSGSIYVINSQQQIQSKSFITYRNNTFITNNHSSGDFRANDLSCPGSYGIITITNITANQIQGTFSGKLFEDNCADSSWVLIENGQFSAPR